MRFHQMYDGRMYHRWKLLCFVSDKNKTMVVLTHQAISLCDDGASFKLNLLFYITLHNLNFTTFRPSWPSQLMEQRRHSGVWRRWRCVRTSPTALQAPRMSKIWPFQKFVMTSSLKRWDSNPCTQLKQLHPISKGLLSDSANWKNYLRTYWNDWR